jgi:hypothetical protein
MREELPTDTVGEEPRRQALIESRHGNPEHR